MVVGEKCIEVWKGEGCCVKLSLERENYSTSLHIAGSSSMVLHS